MCGIRSVSLLIVVAASRLCGAAAMEESISIRVESDLGADVGQSTGSLFEARDGDGRVVAGAGFHDVYNTHFRTDRRTLQFFVRPAERAEPVVERLPDPGLGSGVYLFDVAGKLYAWSSIAEDAPKRWDADSGNWVTELPAGMGSVRKGDCAMSLGDGRLVCSDGRAEFEGREILPAADVGAYSDFYYANGHLCFYHRLRSETDGFTRILACPWTPGAGAVDPDRAVVLDTKYDFETTFAWGQWQDQVLTVSNIGGVYVFDDGAWRVALEAERGVSYQVYSMLRRRDRLLLAQYPTGHVFEYRGESPVEIPDWPPRIAGVTSSALECQTLAVYDGQLFAGVWPWAELWRLDDDDRWHSHGRLYTHPEVTDKTQHPYEAESKNMGLVLNHWGQRISGLVPHGDSLYVSTSSKGMGRRPDDAEFLTAEQWREYGAVLKLRLPGNLAAPISWRDGKTRFEFVIGSDRLAILQDGVELAATGVTAAHSELDENTRFSWGDGILGALRGVVIGHSIDLSAPN